MHTDPTGKALKRSLASFQYSSEGCGRPRRSNRATFDIRALKGGGGRRETERASHPSMREVVIVSGTLKRGEWKVGRRLKG